MFAVVKNGGRQYKVAVGQRLVVNRLAAEAGSTVEINEVLLLSTDEGTSIGAPFVDGAKVVAEVQSETRGPKIIVFKYASKKRRRRRTGHRQDLTVLTITDIVANGKSLAPAKVEKEAPAAEKPAKATKAKKAAKAEEVVSETPATEAPAAEEKKTTRRRRTKAESETASTEE